MPSEIIKAVEASWHSESIEEDFYFGSLNPTKLRRSKKITGALAGLTFGQYRGMDGVLIDDDKVIWLEMIVSDAPGSGRELINCLTKSFSKYGIPLVGDPVPLKPTA